ncbi:MAG: protein-L-isoaspartate(D-aspartate) O-methyltransferase [Bacteroidales bacterium]|nr:protein-L-isoaspartate(D-aspartate) O-methyltransferase [Bacteroidales bacterium]
MIDSYRHKGLRKRLIESIRQKGIKDEKVLDAINEIPRHFFFDSSFMEYAYEDKPFPIGAGQTISQPYTVARQTELLEIKKGDKVLEVGTGSGYQASILFQMGVQIYSIERQKILYQKTKKLLSELKYKVKTFYGDGYKGLPSFAPFDKIIVTAGAPYVPDALKEQLKIGGILVIPVGDTSQTMTKIVRTAEDQWELSEYGEYRFVPLLKEKANDD